MKEALINYTLHLADTALILGHRNSEWCGHGPVLEQDIAITNISLDLIGQSRNFYQYAAKLINSSKKQGSSKAPPSEVTKQSEGYERSSGEASEDSLAYLRDIHEFKNCLLVELPKGDWAITILRQFLFSNYQYILYQQLQNSNDEQLAAIAAKALKEVIYHLRWSSGWVIRLGDGTEESHQRILQAVDELWPYTGEMFMPADYEKEMKIDLAKLKEQWDAKVNAVFNEASLIPPSGFPSETKGTNEVLGAFTQTGGKEGKHTEHLGYILTELQHMQRTYPNCEW